MKNPFEHLRIDRRKELPVPWTDYPVLHDFITVTVYNAGSDYVGIHLGIQDGRWVAGLTVRHGFGYSNCYPGRKWGEFDSRSDALLWSLGSLLSRHDVQGPVRHAVLRRIEQERQLSLFGNN